jgi:hypothetical protein
MIYIITVVITELLIAVLEVSIRKDFENDRRQRQEQKKHGLKAVRGHQYIHIVN